jgi:catechol 2,3-dioxygenase-like lactoylglutathione lyase family enzyme
MRLTLVPIALTLLLAFGAHAEAPLVEGIDHIPIVVADLERAQADFRAMGFVIKPGRPHADGIGNAHVKFPDGTELELITAPAAVDALTTEYHAKQQRGDGPVYFGLRAPNQAELAARLRALGTPVQLTEGALTFPAGNPLHPLFFGPGGIAPTDRPEHYAHANSAFRLSGFWVRANAQERALLSRLGMPIRRSADCGPLGEADDVVLPRGHVLLLKRGPADGAAIGARIEVRNLDAAAATLKESGFEAIRYPRCRTIWVPPLAGHGIWLEFVIRAPK